MNSLKDFVILSIAAMALLGVMAFLMFAFLWNVAWWLL